MPLKLPLVLKRLPAYPDEGEPAIVFQAPLSRRGWKKGSSAGLIDTTTSDVYAQLDVRAGTRMHTKVAIRSSTAARARCGRLINIPSHIRL